MALFGKDKDKEPKKEKEEKAIDNSQLEVIIDGKKTTVPLHVAKNIDAAKTNKK